MQGSTIGNRAEQLALDLLRQNGFKLLERNYHCRSGEIDLIMLDGNILVFIEVRYRKGMQFGLSTETVDYHKQQKLIRAAQHYLQANPKAAKRAARFDVVGLSGELDRPEFSWIKNAFDG